MSASDHEALPTSETDGSHQAVVLNIVESAEEAAERRKYWSKWYHRASMLVSLLITVALAVISIYGIASVGKLGLPEGLMLFQVVFAVIGIIWGVLLFAAEFSGWRWFTINFGCAKNRLGKSVNYFIIGLLSIVFGTLTEATKPMLVMGILLILVSAMHASTYCPCMVNEVDDNDLALSYDEVVRMREAQVLSQA